MIDATDQSLLEILDDVRAALASGAPAIENHRRVFVTGQHYLLVTAIRA